jgi:hypothetical protein
VTRYTTPVEFRFRCSTATSLICFRLAQGRSVCVCVCVCVCVSLLPAECSKRLTISIASSSLDCLTCYLNSLYRAWYCGTIEAGYMCPPSGDVYNGASASHMLFTLAHRNQCHHVIMSSCHGCNSLSLSLLLCACVCVCVCVITCVLPCWPCWVAVCACVCMRPHYSPCRTSRWM